MRVLVTGADGFIGRHLCFFFKNKKIFYKAINYKYSQYDRIVKNIYFSHIVHLAFDFKNKKKNFYLLKKIINVASRNKSAIIFPSTCAYIYKNFVKAEKSLFPINNYVKTKILLEKELISKYYKNKIGDLTILRIFNVYGKFQNPKYFIIPKLINLFTSNIKIVRIKFALNYRDFIHVDDVNNAIYKSLFIKKLNIIDLGTGNAITILDLANKIKNILKSKKKNNLR
jgi:nucleoside-diphosphate-sugar epimerase